VCSKSGVLAALLVIRQLCVDPMRASATNRAAILLGATLAVGGAVGLLFPTGLLVFHHDTETTRVEVERVTPQGTRVYGILSIMFGVSLIWYAASPTRRKAAAIESYVWELSQELNRRFGVRQYYTVAQVSHAAQVAGFTNVFIAYAHAMFCDRGEFDSYYTPLRVACTYDGLREVVGRRYFDGAMDFNGATIDRMARALYEDETTFTQSAV
jgi:hypothetical protein